MKKINYLDSVIQPIITEKATSLSEQNKVIFKVRNESKSKVIRGRIGFKKGYKKAMITLKKGQSIDLASGA